MTIFAPLPSGFPNLEFFARQADGSIPPPPNFLSIGERVYQACVGRTTSLMPELRRSIRRRIPYAMWLDSQRDINTEEQVVNWYFGSLNDLKIDATTRTKRALTPLLHTYVIRFDLNIPEFRKLAENLQSLAKRCDSQEVPILSLATLHRRFDFFNPGRVGTNVAIEYISSSSSTKNIDSWFESIGLWSGLKETPLGWNIYKSALLLPSSNYKNEKAIDALMAWSKSYEKNSLSVDLKALLAETLLKPWLDRDPADELKNKIGDFCVEILGDPRFEGFSWSRVDLNLKALLIRWLTGRTLDTFFDVLRHSADSIWQYRQEFWTPYYRQGYITEAWAILGPDAHRYVKRKYHGADLAYGLLSGQSDEGQSVLLMRMGDYLFCEWSHNGKLRATSIESPKAPKMYGRNYDTDHLYFDSDPFRSNTGTDHYGLPHLHSENKWWQTTAASFIYMNLGIRR